jgi:3-deoxy-D-manno-octulosonic-acid transferase
VWFHALSVGETLSVVPLVEALQEERPDLHIVFSTATETGLKMARTRLGSTVEDFFTLPHDFPWSMRNLVNRIQPVLFVLVETDLWPNLVDALKHRGVPAVLVNGRISPGSFARLRRLSPVLRPFYQSLNLLFVQSSEDRERYRALGVRPECVHALGNLKFDSLLKNPPASDLSRLRESSGIGAERLVWIGGSTHEGEEEALLEIHNRLRGRHRDLLLVLAPRRIERASQLVELCREHGCSVGRRSLGEKAQGKSVYLLDTLGELSIFYHLGDAAFIGGSMVPFGGHNPLEAVACRKPTFWGPHLFNFREIESSLLQAGCGRKVDTPSELQTALAACLENEAIQAKMKASAQHFLSTHTGCSRQIARQLVERCFSA